MRTDALVAYVATPHAGYLKLFRAYAGGVLYILGSDFIREFKPLVRNLPGVAPEEAREMIQALGIFAEVHILTVRNLLEVRKRHCRIIMPDEDVAHALAQGYLEGKEVVFDGRWRLRWDWGTAAAARRPEGERTVSRSEFDREIMREAVREAERSPDWWRQVGAMLVKHGAMMFAAYNRHMPSDQSEYCYGDPRSNFEPGQCIDVSGALHAEIAILAAAARNKDVTTEGADLYVTTFPCPPCAYAISVSGVRRLFYAEGYSLVAGAEALQSRDVEIVRVEF
ncbi:hypothetical protein HYV30_03010 [Candidatus Kaiserbacteria bacterium]|nr:hypothetical protein [Candidatus Kaiserbacteria bacterium]